MSVEVLRVIVSQTTMDNGVSSQYASGTIRACQMVFVQV